MRTWLILTIALSLVTPILADATPDGAPIYKAKCAMCHGPDGKGKMAAYKSSLSDAQIKALVVTIRDLGKR